MQIPFTQIFPGCRHGNARRDVSVRRRAALIVADLGDLVAGRETPPEPLSERPVEAAWHERETGAVEGHSPHDCVPALDVKFASSP